MIVDAATLAGVIGRVAKDLPDATALIDEGGSLTFRELDQRVRATVAVLADVLPAGVPVAVIGPNHRAWIELYYGVPAAQGDATIHVDFGRTTHHGSSLGIVT